MHPNEMNELRDDERALHDLVTNPRPMSFTEAARLLRLSDDQFLALGLPTTGEVDGEEIYDSKDVVHWLEIKRKDPANFERRIAGFDQDTGSGEGMKQREV